MAWTTPKTYTVGEVLTAATMNTHVRDNLSYLYGGVAAIADSKLGADAASIDMQSIPGNAGDALEFLGDVRASAGGSSLVVRVNNDSTAGNHHSGYGHLIDVNAFSGVSAQVTTYGYIGQIADSGATAGRASGVAGRFPDYAGTDWQKTYLGEYESELYDATNRRRAGKVSGTWLSTAAINRLTFLIDSGANLKQNSRIGLWRRLVA
jgi:hypothetical protein